MKMMERVGEGILRAAEAEEKALDAKLASIENLDEDDFEALRQRRKLELQKKMRQEQDWRQLGHGRYLEVVDTKDFFNSAKKSQRVIAHFYRGVTPRCQIVDAHFEKLAAKHVETRFLKIDAEKNPFLVERLEVIVMPTIVLIKDGRTEHSIRGFDEFGGTDDFSTQDMAYILSTHGMLNFELDRSVPIQPPHTAPYKAPHTATPLDVDLPGPVSPVSRHSRLPVFLSVARNPPVTPTRAPCLVRRSPLCRSEEINQHASRAGLNHLRMEKIKAGEYDDMSDDDL